MSLLEASSPCIVCGGNAFTVVHAGGAVGRPSHHAYACSCEGHGSFGRIAKCHDCGLLILVGRPGDEEVRQAYRAVEDEVYLRHEEYRGVTFQKVADWLEAQVAGKGRLLDVGCYTGLFPWIMQGRGWEAFGLEPSRWAAKIAQERLGDRAFGGFLSESPFPSGYFDVITMWDVLEHCTDPVADLKRIHTLLRPGGELFLSTMNLEAPIVKLLGKRWPWFMHMHLFYFTPRTVSRLLAQQGFQVQKIVPYAHYVSLGYLLWKLEAYGGGLARFGGWLSRLLHLDKVAVKVDLGDFMTVHALKVRD